jgi:diguanylate cyclase (GGDEF)-like protein
MTGAVHRAAPGRPARAVVCAAAEAELPPWIDAAAGANGLSLVRVPDVGEALNTVRRGRPPLLVVDARAAAGMSGRAVLLALKADPYTAVVPCLAISDTAGPQLVSLLDDGADEVLAADGDPAEALARVAAALRRSVRDLSAQPTTRLPAAVAIEREIERRIAADLAFAACYADLDHFKEFNDRYGYHEGDRVIRMVGRILHDAAVGCAGRDAFVGHVGGDDFMLVLPLDRAGEVCTLALEVFDAFVPLQYSEADRRVGYYFGKDRRGQLHRVPLMTLSIGVATTAYRSFRSAAEVSKLASEMKSFAKAKPGSLFAVDRRRDDGTAGAAGGASRTPDHHAPHPSRP